MKFRCPNKLETGLCVAIVAGLAAWELWWRHTPLLQRINPSSYYYSLLQLASEKMEKGEFHAAEDSLALAISKFPDTSDAYVMRGDALVGEGNKGGTISSYQLAIQRLGGGFTNLLSVTQQMAERPLIEEKIRKLRSR